MLKGKSTQPTSRPRTPRWPPRRTDPTCTSCLSRRCPCPWPSSPAAQVRGPPGPGGGCQVCLGLGGLLCVPFSWDLGCCEQAWGQPSALHVPRPGLLC